jgi:hypothetical protein
MLVAIESLADVRFTSDLKRSFSPLSRIAATKPSFPLVY